MDGVERHDETAADAIREFASAAEAVEIASFVPIIGYAATCAVLRVRGGVCGGSASAALCMCARNCVLWLCARRTDSYEEASFAAVAAVTGASVLGLDGNGIALTGNGVGRGAIVG